MPKIQESKRQEFDHCHIMIIHNARDQCAASNNSESEMDTVCLEILLCDIHYFFFFCVSSIRI